MTDIETVKTWARNAIFASCILGVAVWMAGRWPRHREGSRGASPSIATTDAASIREVAGWIDREFASDWRGKNVEPVAPAPDLAVARRLSLALVGTVPSLEEIRWFESLPADDGIGEWTARLLRDRRTSDYLAERLARVFVGVEDGPFILYRRHRLVSWISDQLHANRPYDAMVRDLVTAEGLWTTRPEVNFVTATIDPNDDRKLPDDAKLAARVSRAFLGVRLDCVQCHDDFLGGNWKQRDFHRLAAFFAPSEMTMTGVRDDPARGYEIRYLGKPEKEPVIAAVPFLPGLLSDGAGPRARLAAWVTHRDNKAFARATANRVWALLFNRPLHGPVDDIPLDGALPPGLEILAEDFSRNGFDLARLVRVVAATRAFRLDSRDADPSRPVDAARERCLAAFPLTRLRPEQVAGAILQSARLETIDADSPVMVRILRYFQERDFVRRYGDLGQDEFDATGGTIPQRLVMMNGELVRERTKHDPLMNAATRIAAVSPDDATAVEAAYLAVLTRRPTADELHHFARSKKGGGKAGRAGRTEDLYWTLLNSAEFAWNH